jgi:signal transduction histidine kinase
LRSTLAEAGLLYENAALEVALRVQAIRTAAAVAAARDEADAARRRLERDLHDGVQGRLVAVALDLAATREEHPMSTMDGRLDEAVTHLQTAIRELRQLAQGVHPGPLLGAGLSDAIRSYANRMPLPILVDMDVPGLSADVATALYFTACEALTNACKHARASRVDLHAGRHNGFVTLTVRDDGAGGADPNGTGLRGVAERLATLGGRLTVTSAPGTGTVLRGEVPCAS